MIITFDAETWGPPGFEFQQKHLEWKNLFIGFLVDGKVYQLNEKETMLFLQNIKN